MVLNILIDSVSLGLLAVVCAFRMQTVFCVKDLIIAFTARAVAACAVTSSSLNYEVYENYILQGNTEET